MDSRVSGRCCIFCVGLEGHSDDHVQDHGKPYQSPANADSLDAAEEIGRNPARDDANRDAADKYDQAELTAITFWMSAGDHFFAMARSQKPSLGRSEHCQRRPTKGIYQFCGWSGSEEAGLARQIREERKTGEAYSAAARERNHGRFLRTNPEVM